jgi:hypothetical protein
MAAMYAMLARGRSPVTLLAVYVVVGLVFTVAFGFVVLVAFGGVELHAGRDPTKGRAELIGGLLAVGVGIGVLTGLISGRDTAGKSDPDGRWERLMKRPLTVRIAAVAGPATHVPGLFYLLALDLIVASQHNLPAGVIDLILYNFAWFALPLAALIVAIVDPERARRAIEELQRWSGRHARAIVLFVCFGAGIGLLVVGSLTV